MKKLQLRRTDTCASCGVIVEKGDVAWWAAEQKSVFCLRCVETGDRSQIEPHSGDETACIEERAIEPELDRGIAGASARAEGERRTDMRERRIREKYPRIGGAILALTDDPSSTKVWAQGAVGEERVGAFLETLRPRGIEVLHDRRIPGSHANIDHLVVASNGIWVVDPKRYLNAKIECRDVGGMFKQDVRLYVGGRDRSALIAGMVKQVGLVTRAVSTTAYSEVPIRGALCFVDSQVGMFSKPFRINDVLVTWGRRIQIPLLETTDEQPRIQPAEIAPVAALLSKRFPTAV